jgi:hypothetical protein
MYQIRDALDSTRYAHEYVGTWAFVTAHAPEIAARVGEIVAALGAALFVLPHYGWCGWLAAPGITWALLVPGRERGRFDRRLCALCALGFTAIVILTWATFDVTRYPLPIVACGALCGFAMVDDALRRVTARGALRRVRGAVLLAPAVVVLLVWLGPGAGVPRLRALGQTRTGASGEGTVWRGFALEMRDLCRFIAPGAVVAARHSWSVHLACGNPVLTLPADLQRSPARRARFLERERPRYVVATSGDRRSAWVLGSGFELRARSGDSLLFEVRERVGRPADGWRQPPPLLCAGEADTCRRAAGRS